MPNFSQRSTQRELLDRDDIPAGDIRRNMQELNFINTWLGGHAISCTGLQQLYSAQSHLHICEIGCGGGDNLLALNRWCRKRNIATTFTGIDINPFCIEVARQNLAGFNHQLITADYKTVQPTTRPDIIFTSLFCHHFTNDELVDQLKWMHQHARIGFFINDLHRHALAYYSIKALTAAFSRSYLVKNDAPVSVAKGFAKNEWPVLFDRAGITNFSVQWKWAFRWLVVCKHEPAP